MLSFALANAADHVGPRLNRAQIEQTLHETHLDQEMKDMGMWDEWAMESGEEQSRQVSG